MREMNINNQFAPSLLRIVFSFSFTIREVEISGLNLRFTLGGVFVQNEADAAVAVGELGCCLLRFLLKEMNWKN